MNVFLISPGRTGTTVLANALKAVNGYTSSHESNVKKLGNQRFEYKRFHFECDNRLVFFLADLTKIYGKDGILVKVKRNKKKISESYNKRWPKINIMKAWSQGILLRDLNENNIDVAMDYVDYCYRQIDFFSNFWEKQIEIDIEKPAEGVSELMKIIDKEEFTEKIVQHLTNNFDNKNKTGLKKILSELKFNIRVLFHDLFAKN